MIVASGYTLAFDRLDPPGDSGMVAPRMLGPEVRRCYEEGVGFITAVGVHRDATGRAQARVLAVAKAIGGLRQGAIELTPMQEAVLDLGVEQVLSPALTAVNNAFVQHDARARHPDRGDRHRARAVGRGRAHATGSSREVGYAVQSEFHSPTSQYGQLTRRGTLRPPRLRCRRCARSPTTSSRAASPTSGTPSATPATRACTS